MKSNQEFQPIVQRRPAFKTQPDPGFQTQPDPVKPLTFSVKEVNTQTTFLGSRKVNGTITFQSDEHKGR